MAFNVGAAIGGVAKSLSKGFEDERNEALELATQKIKVFTELGLPKARARKEQLRAKNTIYDKLKDEKFSIPQIAVIMREGKGEAVLSHIDNQRSLYKNYKVNPADIVALSPDFKDTGLTKDMVLENVMGKIDKGMSPTGAMNDTFDKSLTNFFGGDLGSVGKRQMQSMAEATGVDMKELAALAADNITYDPALAKGTVTLFDPVAAQRAKDAMEPTGVNYTQSQFDRLLLADSLQNAGVGFTVLTDGTIRYDTQDRQVGRQATQIVRTVISDYYKQRDPSLGKYTPDETVAVQALIDDALAQAGILDVGTGQGQGGGQGQGQGQGGGQGQGQGSNPYTGLGGTTNISNQVIRDAKGKSAQQQTTILAQARQAIVAALTQNATPGTSAQSISDEADRIIADIQSKI